MRSIALEEDHLIRALRRVASFKAFRMMLMGICVILVGAAVTQGIALADGDPSGEATI